MVKWIASLLAVAALATVVATSAMAQPKEKGKGGGGGMLVPMLMKADTNGDKKIDAKEWEALGKSIDKEGTGIDEAKLKTWMESQHSAMGGMKTDKPKKEKPAGDGGEE